ncbi:hypothetical protein LXL04_011051 [Taraxacum kok-saghyz]
MARTNKYASFNFNDIYDKKITSTNNHHRASSSSSSISSTNPTNKTALSNSRIHGNMLVLSRPSPKPIVPPRQPSPPAPPATQPPDQTPIKSDSISLRPLGRTGSGQPLPSPIFPPVQVKDSPLSPKTNKFVPPHLRPGFHGREEKPESQIPNIRQSPLKSPIYREEEGRPKSGDPVALLLPIRVDNLISFERMKDPLSKSAHSSLLNGCNSRNLHTSLGS